MEEKRNIEHQVEKTMQALDGIERPSADDFFYARLEARMSARPTRRPSMVSWLSPGLVTAAAAIALLIVFNILTVLHYNQQYGDTGGLHQQNLEVLAEEYYLEIPLIYELENEE